MWSKGQRLLGRPAAALARWKPAPLLQTRSAATTVPAPTSALGAALLAATEDDPPAPAEPSIEERLADAESRGFAEGQMAAEAAMAAERARLAATVADVAALRRRVLDLAEHEVMQVASGMARRILHREVQLDPDILLAMARVALGRLGDQVAAVVSLHPQDLAAVSSSLPSGAGLRLEADASLPRGGCRIKAEHGEIDLGVDAQLDELSRLLLGETTRVDGAALH